MIQTERMDKTIRKYTSFDEMKADEYRYWQSRPVHERVNQELTPSLFYAQPRATKDLDLLVKPDTENAKAVFAALAQFGAPLQGLTTADFAEPGPFFRMGRKPIGVDTLTEIPGVEFDAAWQHRVEDVIDPASRLKASFLSREYLMQRSWHLADRRTLPTLTQFVKRLRVKIRNRQRAVLASERPAVFHIWSFVDF